MIEKRVWPDRATASAAAISRPSPQNLYYAMAGLVLIALLSVSCSGMAPQTTAANTLPVDYADALPVETQLLAGSLLLEDTDQAISASQAPELLLLWKAFRSLGDSDTAAQVEIDAVITQIEETMSAEQLEAISAMHLTSSDLATVLQQHASLSAASDRSTSGTVSSVGFGSQDGGFVVGSGPQPGGGDGMAFLAPSDGQGTILSAASTEVPKQNLTANNRTEDRTTLRLVESLITVLESKADA